MNCALLPCFAQTMTESMEVDGSSERKVATKHCAYGICNSDSRYMDTPEWKVSFLFGFLNLNVNQTNVQDGRTPVVERTLTLCR